MSRDDLDRYRRRGYRWWSWRYFHWRFFRQVRRIVRATTGASSLFFTLAGVILAVAGIVLAAVDRSFFGDWIGGIVLAVILLVTFVLSGLLVLRMLPPEELAAFLVRGRSTEEILQVIAVRIRRLAGAFVAKTGKLNGLADELLAAAGTPDGAGPGLIRRAEKGIDSIGDLFRKRDLDFRRLVALKQEAALEMDMSRRGLGDHVLQFSPVMFKVGVRKYLRNLEEMVELTQAGELEEKVDKDRFGGLIYQNGSLEDDCSDRVTLAELLLRFHRLHDDVRSLAANRSTSSSLQAYSRALSTLAGRQAKKLAARPRWWPRRLREHLEKTAYLDTRGVCWM